MSGTSMATSHVSGAIALLLSLYPHLTPAEIKLIMRRSMQPLRSAKNPRSGANVKYVIEGKLEGTNLTGSWNHDNTKGDFKLTKK